MDLIRIKHLFALSIILYLLAGQVTHFDSFLALGRTVSYFPFFLMGYYCTKEKLESSEVEALQTLLLLAVLISISCLLAFVAPIPVGFIC